jgi:hypothetical protein
LVSLVFAAWLFQTIVPASVEVRRMIVAIPALFMLAASVGPFVAERTDSGWKKGLARALFPCVCLATILISLPIAQKPSYGYIAAAKELVRLMPAGSAALVSSDSDGEGALISEVALLDPDPSRYIVRTSKFLTESDWGGKNFRMLAASQEEVGRMLADVPISFILLDLRAGVGNPDHNLLQDYLVSHSSEWHLVNRFGAGNVVPPGVALYSSVQGPRAMRHLVVSMKYMTGGDFVAGPPPTP